MNPIDKEMMEMLKEINEKLDKSQEREEMMLQKLEAMSKNQLEQILTQAVHFAEEMKRSNDHTEMMINYKALKNTLTIDKEELQTLLTNAFSGSNKELIQDIDGSFENLHKNLKKIYGDIMDSINIVNKNNFEGIRAVINNIEKMRSRISDIDSSISKVEQTVRTIPGRSLY
jgi:predicted transcriptional regulator